jgi:GT2 family glycosyltransferase
MSAAERPDLSVILVNYNNSHETRLCLEQLTRQTYRSFEVIVVDNASSKPQEARRLQETVAKYFSELRIHLYLRPINDGFAGGNNFGIRHSTGSHLCILNSDTIFSPEFLTQAMGFFEAHSKIGIFSPRIMLYSDPTMPWSLGGQVDFHYPLLTRVFNKRHFFDLHSNHPYPVQMIAGCCMFIRRSVLRLIGLFDPNYFMYFEDTDLCYRIRQAGYHIIVDPRQVLYHAVDERQKRLSAVILGYLFRNHLYFILKHAKPMELLCQLCCVPLFYGIHLYNRSLHQPEGYYFLKIKKIVQGLTLGLKRRWQISARTHWGKVP